MKEAKKKSPARIYVTFAVIIIICGLIGGIVGVAAVSNEFSVRNLGEQFNLMLASLGPWCYVPGFLLLVGATWYYFRGKRMIPQALEDDELFPQANLTLCRAMFLANLATVLMFLAMALSYASSWGFNLSWFLLIGHIIWMTAIQARIISATKKLFPEKRGDIFDFKFQKDCSEKKSSSCHSEVLRFHLNHVCKIFVCNINNINVPRVNFTCFCHINKNADTFTFWLAVF